MNRYFLSVALLFLLCIGYSDNHDNGWESGDAIYQATPAGRIHGDERSQQQRNSDSISGVKGNNSTVERHCAERSRSIDPGLTWHYLAAKLLATR